VKRPGVPHAASIGRMCVAFRYLLFEILRGSNGFEGAVEEFFPQLQGDVEASTAEDAVEEVGEP